MNDIPRQQCSLPRIGQQADILARASPIDGLYIHVPFCFHKCHYCDFYSIVDKPGVSGEDRQAVFTRRLIGELLSRASHVNLRPRSIFVGGGTPTLLRPELWQQILIAMRNLGLLEQVREFTVEANPETISAPLMDLLVAGGVNRLSIGAQSFHVPLLKTLERWHDPDHVAQGVHVARAAGMTNINLDLIFAISGQTMNMLDADLDVALDLEPSHLSAYNLTYEPNTALTVRLKMGQFTPVPEDLERDMYHRVMQRLDDAGFEHYEVSNWARRVDGGAASIFRCQHNMLYWTSANWLAIGPSGASHVDGHRWKNEPHLGRYLRGGSEPSFTDYECLPAARSVGEQLMMRLRLRDGVPLEWLGQNLANDDPRHATIGELLNVGMLERDDISLRLTRRGLFVADSVIAKLL